jgi:hypothetical protein
MRVCTFCIMRVCTFCLWKAARRWECIILQFRQQLVTWYHFLKKDDELFFFAPLMARIEDRHRR